MDFSLSCCLVFGLLLIFNWNEVSDAKAITQHNTVDTVHHRRDGVIEKSLPQTRQQNCQSFLTNYPMECNATLLDYNYGISNILSQSEYNLTDLNNLFKKVCVSSCIDPLLRFHECLNMLDTTYINSFIKQSACGTHNGDFCHVLYLRRFQSNQEYLDELIGTCPFPLTVLNCGSANSDCRAHVSRFISNMGCCTIPLIGDVRSCFSNVSEPCQQFQSGSGYYISPALWCLLVAVLSALFY